MTTTLAAPAAQLKTLREVIYCRISDDAEGLGIGVGRQEADCRQRIERDGMRLVAPPFIDNDRGASRHSRKPRPAYRAMLAMAERGELDVIVAYSNSRLTRRMSEFEELVKLAESGVRIMTVVSGDDDLSTADGLMVARIKASVDAAEADRTSERVRRQNADKIQRGEWLGGPRPFGWKDDASAIEPTEAEMIRQGAEHVLDGGSVGQLVREWNASGVTTARGASWRHVTINRVLTRWRNCGIYEHRGKVLPDVEPTWESILTLDQVERLRAILNDPRRENAAGYAPVHLMSGIARCGKCGHVLKSGAVRSRGKTYRMYRCSGPGCGLAILIDVLNEVVISHAIRAYAFGQSGRFASSAQAETYQILAETNRQLADVLRERAEIEQAINDELTSVVKMRPTLQRLKDAEAKLRDEIARAYRDDAHAAIVASAAKALTPLPGHPAGRKIDMQQIFGRPGQPWTELDGSQRVVETMRERWEAMPLEQRRKLVRALLEVRVMPGRGADRITITDQYVDV
jgi:site-specific DNA recombinase